MINKIKTKEEKNEKTLELVDILSSQINYSKRKFVRDHEWGVNASPFDTGNRTNKLRNKIPIKLQEVSSLTQVVPFSTDNSYGVFYLREIKSCLSKDDWNKFIERVRTVEPGDIEYLEYLLYKNQDFYKYPNIHTPLPPCFDSELFGSRDSVTYESNNSLGIVYRFAKEPNLNFRTSTEYNLNNFERTPEILLFKPSFTFGYNEFFGQKNSFDDQVGAWVVYPNSSISTPSLKTIANFSVRQLILQEKLPQHIYPNAKFPEKKLSLRNFWNVKLNK